jgi:inositol-pentakisphosphate 2-kinase
MSSAFTRALLPLLVDNKLLPILGTLQRTLDAFDIEGLVHLWNLSNSQTSGDSALPIASGMPQPTMDEWVSFIDEYLTTNARSDYILEGVDTPEAKERLRYYMMAYLMSATFKDCSVILRLGSGSRDRITVIDLDPKKIEKLRTWEVQDLEIVRGFKESLRTGVASISSCKDAGFRA